MENGEMHVIKGQDGVELVFYVNEETPKKELIQLIDEGIYSCRDATLEEKEYCFWCIDKLNKPIAEVQLIDLWREKLK